MSLPSRAGAFLPAIAVLLLASSALAQNIASIAGSGSPGLSGDNANALAARIDTVYGVAVDAQGNVYLADSRNHSVRKVFGGTITTVAGTGTEGNGPDGGPATSASTPQPQHPSRFQAERVAAPHTERPRHHAAIVVAGRRGRRPSQPIKPR